jgi:hypothetical protein
VAGIAAQLPAAQAASSAWLRATRCWSWIARWFRLGCLVDGVQPYPPGGKSGDVAAELVGGVVRQRVARAGGGTNSGRVQRFAFGQDGAVHPEGSPLEVFGVGRFSVDGEQPVGQFLGHGEALGAQRRDEDRDVDRSRRGEADRMQHPHAAAVPVDGFTSEQTPKGADVVA